MSMAGRVGFEPTICGSPHEPRLAFGNGSVLSPGSIDWEKFDAYTTQSFAKRTAQEYRRGARRYVNVLLMGDASSLLCLSDCKRRPAIGPLAALPNFTGFRPR